MSPSRRRARIDRVRTVLSRVSERRVCRVLGQHRSTQRRILHGRNDEQQLTKDIVALVPPSARVGYSSRSVPMNAA